MKLRHLSYSFSGEMSNIQKQNRSEESRAPEITRRGGWSRGVDRVDLSVSGKIKKSTPSPLTYSGHGTLEVYSESMSTPYVVGHEMRHVQSNRLKALAKGEKVEQNVTYSVTRRSGKLIVTGGVTKAKFSKKDDQLSLGKEESSQGNKEKKVGLDLSFLEKRKGTLEEEIRKIKIASSHTERTNKGDKKTESKESYSDKLKIIHLKREIGLLTQKIVKTKQGNAIPSFDSQGSAQSSPSVRSQPAIQEDHITLRNMSDLFSKAFRFATTKAPQVTHFDHAFSALKVQKSIEDIIAQDTAPPVEQNIKSDSGFKKVQSRSLNVLQDRLSDLRVSVTRLRLSSSFATHLPTSSNSSVLTATSSVGAKDAAHSVTPSALSLPHRVVSDSLSDPYQELDISGSVKLNGYTVEIETSDSLNDIMNKINRGEDINNNGTLDLLEDLNGNGALDIITIGEGRNRVIAFEDIDMDRVLDITEDINGNERIDGGSAQIGIKASIENNQLVLTSMNGLRIELSDDNSALSSLGFLTVDAHNQTILKHYQSTSQSYMVLNQDPQKTAVNVNGLEYARSQNIISDIIPSVTLELKKPSKKAVTVTVAPDTFRASFLVKDFIRSFNRAIGAINDLLEVKKTMKKDPAIQRMRKNLVKNSAREITAPQGKVASLESTGITRVNTQKRNHQEIAITQLLNDFKKNLHSSLAIPLKGENSIFSSLGELGILTGQDDMLIVNEKRLQTVLEKKPKEVLNLFANKADGIAVRIERQIDEVLEPTSGAIATRRQIVSKNTSGKPVK